jgi:hypothetical protein
MKQCVVYVIRSKDRKRAYVGLTVAPVVRLMVHHNSGTDPVRELLSASHSVDISRPLSPARAARLEMILIDRMAGRGVQMANRAAGGALGGNEHVVTKDLAIQRAIRHQKMSKFKSQAPATYRLAKQNGWLDDIEHQLFLAKVKAKARYWENVGKAPLPPTPHNRSYRRKSKIEQKPWRRPIVKELRGDPRKIGKVKLVPGTIV